MLTRRAATVALSVLLGNDPVLSWDEPDIDVDERKNDFVDVCHEPG